MTATVSDFRCRGCDSTLRQQGEYRWRGGHFIRPVPTVTIL